MNTRIIILAAGKGKRMQSDIPKVLHDLNGKPIISHLAESVMKTGIDPSPVVVVSPESEKAIRDTLGGQFTYVVQGEQLGTGHAVQCTESTLHATCDTVIVLYGDMPFITAETILHLKELHEKSGSSLAMMTVRVPDFKDWRSNFYDFGRVVRNVNGDIVAIIEKKDATPEQLEMKEINPSFFSFRADWLWEHLKMLAPDNMQKEYYLTDLIHMAISEGLSVASMEIDPLEAVGVNTSEHLELSNRLKRTENERSR